MTPYRISLPQAGSEVYRAIAALDSSAELEPRLRELVKIRASQINGCAFCVDMHSVDAQKAGEAGSAHLRPGRVARESVLRRARARCAGADRCHDEAAGGGVPDDVYERAAAVFADEELGNLVGVIIAINAWNRVAVTTALQPPVLA